MKGGGGIVIVFFLFTSLVWGVASIDEAEIEHLKAMLLTPVKAETAINNKA